MIIYDSNIKENMLLTENARDINAYVSDSRLDVSSYTDGQECIRGIAQGKTAGMAVTAIPKSGKTDVPEEIRAQDDDASIMLVVDQTLSPVSYLNPRIRACSLLVRPYSRNMCRKTLREFMSDYYNRYEAASDNVLIVENYGEKTKIPVSQIYYIEVRGKKVFIRTRAEEYSEYATLENILDELGDKFIRCHRSFAFNKDFFQSVKLSENVVNLLHDVSIPLSRSFKSAIRGFVHDAG